MVIADGGEVVYEHAEFLGIRTNNFAEYSGLIHALTKAVEFNAEEAEFVMDSELVIKQMRGEYRVKSAEMKELHADAVALSVLIPRVSYRNVRRNQEMIPRADALLNAEMDRHRSRFFR